MNHFAVLLTLLRDRPNFLEDIRRNVKVERKSVSLLATSCIFFAIYGAIIGSSSSWMQLLSSAVKLPALYLITLVICLPTLFFFDVLFGSKLGFGQYVALLLSTMSTISVLLFSFAPVTLFFLISIHDYDFFLLVNVAIFALTGFIGTRLFYNGMQQISARSQQFRPAPPYSEIEAASEYQPEYDSNYEPGYDPHLDEQERADEAAYRATLAKLPQTRTQEFVPPRDVVPARQSAVAKPVDDLQQTRDRLLKFWLLLYALVGSQLGWTLRPFFGAPGEPFQLFRSIEGNFYATMFRVLLNFLGFN
ncbi:hypothetical protein ACQ4M4_06890 [Leptolyngbya sp. AN02str]|uniref:hypothetical protein n=1 Tax=Leptolyngbya sp. AN02str TaxID=3423363 RepID=UPI003D319215